MHDPARAEFPDRRLLNPLGVRVVGREYDAEEGSMLALRPHRRRTVVAPADDGRYAALVMMLPIAQFSSYSSSDGSRPSL